MTRSEIELIRQALQVLHKLVPDDEPRASDPRPRPCPIITFAQRYLVRQPGTDMSSAELKARSTESLFTEESGLKDVLGGPGPAKRQVQPHSGQVASGQAGKLDHLGERAVRS